MDAAHAAGNLAQLAYSYASMKNQARAQVLAPHHQLSFSRLRLVAALAAGASARTAVLAALTGTAARFHRIEKLPNCREHAHGRLLWGATLPWCKSNGAIAFKM
jgi:hypothetical protein